MNPPENLLDFVDYPQNVTLYRSIQRAWFVGRFWGEKTHLQLGISAPYCNLLELGISTKKSHLTPAFTEVDEILW